MDETKQERRFHFRGRARAGRRVEISYHVAGANREMKRAVTSNIGVGGAFVLTDAPLEIGAALRVSIEVPTTEETIETDATVRWVILPDAVDELHAAGMGIKFQRLDVDALLSLSEYFASLTPTIEEED